MDPYVKHVLAQHPEEGPALGLPGPLRLRDPSPEGLLAEGRAHEAALRDLDTATHVDPLDRAWARRALRFRLHALETGAAARNLEVAMIPYASSEVAVARGLPAGALAGATEAFLAGLGRTLRASGGPFEPTIVEAFVEHLLPAARDAFAARGEAHAAAAYDAFRAVVEALPQGHAALGPDEVRWRLAHLGVVEDGDAVAALDARARDALAALAREAGEVAAELGVTLSPGVVGTFDAQLEDVGKELSARCDRATTFVRERGLFAIPETLRARLVPAPSALVHGNWPCPLLDPAAEGAVLVPAAWPAFWADVYAVHEGIPGHYLQTWLWQQGGQSPARHLGIADDLAAATQDFAPLLAIEGWAVHVEELLRREGYFEGLSRLAVLTSHAIRAARARVDLGLACGTMDDEEAVRIYVEGAWMPVGWARGQLLRHRRIPLQGLTYFAGRESIERLEGLWHDAGRGTGADFRAWLLSFGPIPPDWLAAELAA